MKTVHRKVQKAKKVAVKRNAKRSREGKKQIPLMAIVNSMGCFAVGVDEQDMMVAPPDHIVEALHRLQAADATPDFSPEQNMEATRLFCGPDTIDLTMQLMKKSKMKMTMSGNKYNCLVGVSTSRVFTEHTNLDS